MKAVLTADFGSTFTKLTAIDVENRKILAKSRAFTTIAHDVMDGYNAALSELMTMIGDIDFAEKYACSSAAGGLKMVSSGLVPDLTAKASQLAASSAGAKVIKTYSYELTETEKEEIYEINPDIILLSGGIDGGNKKVITKNAETLAGIDRNFSVIVAGNKTAQADISRIFNSAGKDFVICENVMPEFDKLDIMPAKSAIRDIFIKNIISAKGLDKAQKIMDTEIIPTPLAVFNAAELLEQGCGKVPGIGSLMVFDVGGATTDVYSMADGLPTGANTYIEGLKEPFAKRTVEGDIGVRYSLTSLVQAAGEGNIAEEAGVSPASVAEWVKKCSDNQSVVAEDGTDESRIDQVLATFAVQISAERHVGFLEKQYTPMGEMFRQTGKDLTQVKHIIGTGGSVIDSKDPMKILKKAAYSMNKPMVLKPVSPSYLLDKSYIFSAMGLLSQSYPEIALEIMKNEFITL